MLMTSLPLPGAPRVTSTAPSPTTRSLAVRTKLSLVALGLALASPAAALDGELVEDGKFPFVVKLHIAYERPETKPGTCTATVVEPRLILTAAHCITKPYADGDDSYFPNASNNITIHYIDARGQRKAIKAVDVFFNKAFTANSFAFWSVFVLDSSKEEKDKLKATMPRERVEALERNYRTAVMADVAYLVPERRIELTEYPRFILNEFRPTRYLDDADKWMTAE